MARQITSVGFFYKQVDEKHDTSSGTESVNGMRVLAKIVERYCLSSITNVKRL